MLGVGGDWPYGGKAAGGEKGEVVRQQEEAVSLPVEDQGFSGGVGATGRGALARAGALSPRTLWPSGAGTGSARVRAEKEITVASGTPIRVRRLCRS